MTHPEMTILAKEFGEHYAQIILSFLGSDGDEVCFEWIKQENQDLEYNEFGIYCDGELIANSLEDDVGRTDVQSDFLAEKNEFFFEDMDRFVQSSLDSHPLDEKSIIVANFSRNNQILTFDFSIRNFSDNQTTLQTTHTLQPSKEP